MELLSQQSNLMVDKSETYYHEVFGNHPDFNFLIRIIGYLCDPGNYKFTQSSPTKFLPGFSFFSSSRQASTTLSQAEYTHLLST